MKQEFPPGVEVIGTEMNLTAEGFLFTTIILANVLWYWIKIIVRSKGYPMNLFLGHSRDIKFLKEIIMKEVSPEKVKHYRFLLYSLYGCLAGAILSILIEILITL